MAKISKEFSSMKLHEREIFLKRKRTTYLKLQDVLAEEFPKIIDRIPSSDSEGGGSHKESIGWNVHHVRLWFTCILSNEI